VKSRLSTGSKKPKIKTPARSHMVVPSRQRRKEEHVHLAGVVEHRCPYCLEVVEKKDPRGVRACPICGTHHHADCWAVTGTCQVPHG
jgi:ribosomal protein L37AE/L43A